MVPDSSFEFQKPCFFFNPTQTSCTVIPYDTCCVNRLFSSQLTDIDSLNLTYRYPFIYSKNWVSPIITTPDFYWSNHPNPNYSAPEIHLATNTFWKCGYQNPRIGSGMVGICVYNLNQNPYHEYVSTTLSKTLRKNRSYCVTYYVNLPDSALIICNNIGAYFHEEKIYQRYTDAQSDTFHNNLCKPWLHPQIQNPTTNLLNDTAGWVPVSGSFIAKGNESYITIGNFTPPSNCDTLHRNINIWSNDLRSVFSYNAYYFLDDVSVIENRALQNDWDDTLYCPGAAINQTLKVWQNCSNILWSTGDTTQSIQVNNIGTYWVQANTRCGIAYDTIHIAYKDISAYHISIANSDSIKLCNNLLPLQLSTTDTLFAHYQWSTGDTSKSTAIPAQTGAMQAWVSLTASYQCGSSKDSVYVQINPTPQLNLPTDTTFCSNASITLFGASNAHNVWSTGDTTQTILVTNLVEQFTVSVTSTDANTCVSTDSTHIAILPIPTDLLTQNDTTIYVGDSITVTAIDNLQQYHWSIGDTTQSIRILSPLFASGWVRLSAYTFDGCLVTDSIYITFKEKPPVELPIIIPNPQTAEELFKVINLPNGSIVALYNALGESIPLNKHPYPIATGIYFYHIVLASGKELKGKIVVI